MSSAGISVTSQFFAVITVRSRKTSRAMNAPQRMSCKRSDRVRFSLRVFMFRDVANGIIQPRERTLFPQQGRTAP